MITTSQIREAREKIREQFSSSVAGQPTKAVQQYRSDLRALGQHLNPSSPQRGLHGTSAAMRVLVDSPDSQSVATLRGLVEYCRERPAVEKGLKDQDELKQVFADQDNVIKLSEVLYSLSKVPTEVETGDYARQLANHLTTNDLAGRGWSYGLNSQEGEPALLPTCWSVLALNSHGYGVDQYVTYITQQLDAKSNKAPDIGIQVFALYVLMKAKPGFDQRRLLGWFNNFWRDLSPLLHQDLETNIEYLISSVPNRVFYVRVPWQLYLTFCAAKLSPFSKFVQPATQRRLESILSEVASNGGLRYPHSGNFLSSRTNGILYEILGEIAEEIKMRRLPFKPFLLWSRFWGSRIPVVILFLTSLAIIIYSLVDWWRTGSVSAAELAPNFLAAFVIVLLKSRRL